MGTRPWHALQKIPPVPGTDQKHGHVGVAFSRASSATDVVSTPIPSTVSVAFVNLFRGRKQRYLGDRSIDSGTSTTHHDKSAADKRLADMIGIICSTLTNEL